MLNNGQSYYDRQFKHVTQKYVQIDTRFEELREQLTFEGHITQFAVCHKGGSTAGASETGRSSQITDEGGILI